MRWCFALLVLAAACRTAPYDLDGGLPPGSVVADLAGGGRDLGGGGGDLAGLPTSCCGQAGNPGNEIGVGKFCQSSTDCQGQLANLCVTIPGARFCTRSCSPTGGSAQCGSGASCQCGSGNQCACVPGECLTPPPGC